jgi:regulator of PEP synthase PpsR (kinase-PPPase family)
MDKPPVWIVSGGRGSSGEQVVRTALAQFEDVEVPVIIVPDVREIDQLQTIVGQAAAAQGIIVHTLVNPVLRKALKSMARERQVRAVDLLGPLLGTLSRALHRRPLGKPGLYRQLREEYFRRIEAIEFAVNHDDGRKVHELDQAEIVLTGVSRVGKTPLSMYLSTRGWKAANVPLVKDIPPPKALFEIDRRRVVGLTIDPDQLAFYRRRREENLGVAGKLDYADPDTLEAELNFAWSVFRQGQFALVDMTDKSIEEGADEVIACVTNRLRAG